VQKQLLDLQLGQNDAVKPSIWQNLGNAVLSAGNAYAFTARSSASVAENMGKEGSELRKLQDKLTSFLGDNDSLISSNKKVAESFDNIKVPDVSFTRNEKTVSTVTAKTDVESGGEPLTGLVGAMVSANAAIDEQLAIARINFEDFRVGFNQIMEYAAEDAVVGFGQFLAGIATGASGIGELGALILNTFGNVAEQTGKLAIGIGISIEAIKKALENLGGIGAIAAGIGLIVLGGIAKSQASKIAGGGKVQKFEAGGIVGGSSYYGDKILARVNSQEMILNTDQQEKLYGMMQPRASAQVIIPSTTIKGSDILISYTREKNKNSRY